MQNTAHPAVVALEQAGQEPTAAQQPAVAAETFRCRECNRTLPAAMLAFDTDAARGEGVCLTCDGEHGEQYTGGGEVWPLGIVAAGADDGRYSLMGREVL
jgi:hypothetical protein